MKIGAMNNPQKDLMEEIEFIKEQFEFIDLTLEPGVDVDVKKVKPLLKDVEVVGHTAWSLPLASPFASVRKACEEEFEAYLKIFKELNVNLVNVHPDMTRGLDDPDKILENNIAFFKAITKQAKKHGITVMMENTKAIFNEIEIIKEILKQVPSLKLHWDVGHANLGNLGEKRTEEAFKTFKKKIVHVHFSDNNGIEDQHLPLGTGNINWPFIVKTLRDNGYDSTVTLEIHTQDRSYELFSRDKLQFILENLPEE